MAKKKDQKAPKQKPKAKAATKKAAVKPKSAAKKTAAKKPAAKKPAKAAPKSAAKTVVKKTSKPAAAKGAKPATAKSAKPAKASAKPAAKISAKPADKKPTVVKPAAKKEKAKNGAKDQKQAAPVPQGPRKAYTPPVEKPKGTPTQLSMALEEVKPAISFKPRVTKSRSGNLVYQLEYTIRSSPTILYEFLTTPSGLAQWFADKVDIYDHKCIFEWEGFEETATIIDAIEDQYIRYKWDNSDEDEYFEFRISKNEITSDTILTITDFASERDMKDEKLLWDSQVKLLVQQVGG